MPRLCRNPMSPRESALCLSPDPTSSLSNVKPPHVTLLEHSSIRDRERSQESSQLKAQLEQKFGDAPALNGGNKIASDSWQVQWRENEWRIVQTVPRQNLDGMVGMWVMLAGIGEVGLCEVVVGRGVAVRGIITSCADLLFSQSHRGLVEPICSHAERGRD